MMPKAPHVVTGNSNSPTSRIHVLEVLGNAIVGGMENYVKNLIAHLPVDDFKVTVLCPFESAFTSQLRAQGHQVFIAPLRDDPPWRTIEMICTLIRESHIDLLHAHLMNAHTVAAIAGRLTDTPTVATLHGMSLHPQEISVIRTTGSHTIVVCREAWSQAMAVGLASDTVSLVPNGIDLAVYNPVSADRSILRNAIGIGPDDLLIGFVGRLAWEKGPDKFVKAAEQILQHRPDVHFALVGTGLMENELRAAIERAGIEHNVHLAGMWQDPSKVYPSLDLMLHTSRADAMPLAILEATASGVPVVAIGVGGVPELIEAGETGLLIGTNEWPGIVSEYPGDWDGVAKAALTLIDHPERLQRMSAASVRRAAALYDIRQSAASTAQIFRQLMRVRREATRLHSVS
ncbi:glycosyltransferase family 4 protein [Mesorhizobium sp. ES1-1]|uniref:glycosyltransferase family 4 protein n=1 Tax=Mesorhizobium sp. ES1-1 TaxID=2876629 RepID=UPI001CCC1204|nr:glycosyltransferase family 4 protein [Mesorhizobium sp. ES1-1]MBZ9676342.1 glycosyltransferase family 4 protein [Mesorhizobium sp. ES1-1]